MLGIGKLPDPSQHLVRQTRLLEYRLGLVAGQQVALRTLSLEQTGIL